jgi:hypothetical protein
MAETLPSLIRPEQGPVLPGFGRLAPPPPLNRVVAEVEARTRPGDVVLDLFGRGAWVARTAMGRQRRAITFESSALSRLLAEIVLRPPDVRHFDAALASLAYSPLGEASLRQSLNELFASRCATCGRATIVDEFIWEADGAVPFRKVYRCLTCRDQLGGGEIRMASTDAVDAERAVHLVRGAPARQALLERFAVVEGIEALPDEFLGLYTARTLTAMHAVVNRLDSDLRAAPIEAALRLALLYVLLPASRLNGFPGRVSALRVSGGHVRPPAHRQWRERNPWLLFEEGCRHVRTFIHQLDATPGGPVLARLGEDPRDLADGTSNVVIRRGFPDAGEPGDLRLDRARDRRIRLALSQAPSRWTGDTLAFAYLTTGVLLGRQASATLPLRDLLSAVPRADWGWQATTLGRGLAAVAPMLADDGRAVVLVDPAGPEALVAGVLGGAAAGYRLAGAFLEPGDEVTGGTVELVPVGRGRGPGAAAAVVAIDAGQPIAGGEPGAAAEAPAPGGLAGQALPGETQPAADLALPAPTRDEVADHVGEIAVRMLQARGEPADFACLLGDILVGLDEAGLLARFARPEEGATASAAAGTGPLVAA